jgi:2-polyprenyl-6-methoxyphenol hydroxylase-like FAD-dependent oxidoreductase
LLNDQRKHAVVIGGSIAGLFVALLLRRNGWFVDVFERSDTVLAARGAGIMAHPELFDAVAMLGLSPERDFGVEIQQRRMLDQTGKITIEHDLPQTATSWNQLYEVLRKAFSTSAYHLSKELKRVEQCRDNVSAVFTDGTKCTGDVLIAADGFRSVVREQFLPGIEPIYAGYVAWRGMAEESYLSSQTRNDIFPYFSFCLPPGEQILGYPVAGSEKDLRVGHRRYNFVWYRPADKDSELPHMLTDENGHVHRYSIPPPLIGSQILHKLREDANRLLAPQFRDVVHNTEQPFLQPIYDLESPQLSFGRVALIGDAAFVARPHVGAGVTKAMQDAICLAEALGLEADVQLALTTFDHQRVEVGRHIIKHARNLGACVSSNLRTQEEMASTEQYRNERTVLAETATLNFIRNQI